MATVLLIVGILSVIHVLNGIWPQRGRLLMVWSFFASWLTVEFAPFWLVLEAIVAGALVADGALDEPRGTVGLLLVLGSVGGLVYLMIRNRRAIITTRSIHEELDLDEDAPAYPKIHLLVPPLMGRRRNVKRTRNIPFAVLDSGRKLKLDLFEPTEPGTKRPGILQIHGGAWIVGDKREQGIPLLYHLAANGWVGINANYRLSPKVAFPTHLQDLKRAIAWWRAHAEEFGGDPDFLCVTGGSAGGHLTALVGLTANDPEYQPGFEDVDTTMNAAVPYYGIYDFTNRSGHQPRDTLKRFYEPVIMKKKIADDPDAFRKASPIDLVHADAPPFFVIHGSKDSLAPVEDARTFVHLLRETSEAPVLYAEMIGAQHAFDAFPSYRNARVIEAVERFLHSVHRAYQRGREGDEVSDREVAESMTGN